MFVLSVLIAIASVCFSMFGSTASARAARPARVAVTTQATDLVPAPPTASPAEVPQAERDRVLPPGWRQSSDRVVTTDGDSTGLHVLVADAKDGYSWRTAATLSEPGTETDQWIGQVCVTGSGRRAVVVYAPRQLVNDEDTFRGGALVAVVDLDTGTVKKLPVLASLAYYDPGCGAGESAVITQNFFAGNDYVSRMMTVDAAAGKVVDTVDARGQVTSAVPTASGLVAAYGSYLVSVGNNGALRDLAGTDGAPFRLAADSGAGVGYEVRAGGMTELHRYAAGHDAVLARVAQDSVQLHQVAGDVFVQGAAAGTALRAAGLPQSWHTVNVSAGAQMSSHGVLAVISASNQHEAAGAQPLATTPGEPLPVSVAATVPDTSAHLSFTVPPDPLRSAAGAGMSPALGNAAASRAARPQAIPQASGDPSTDTTDPNRGCAIARNDPKIRSLQPTPEMGEWAADLAVKGQLTVQRPAGWNGSTLPAYTPQGLFPPHALTGGGQVPAQILLGVMAQESNMWQAGPNVTDGESGNFNIGGFYGRGVGVNTVNFANVDCGYGATQVTTGMSVKEGNTVYTPVQQLAIAVDYAANTAAGLQILQDKWNQMKQVGVLANNADPSRLENWWFALWAYNSGWHAQSSDPTQPYGLGWTNNMANEDYPADRAGFLSTSYDDAKTPNHWSYPERVMGWTAHALLRLNWATGIYHTAYKTAAWPSGTEPQRPSIGQFCQQVNQCDMTQIVKPDPSQFPNDPGSHCLRPNLQCWWHVPSSWVDCSQACGFEVLSYQPGSAEPSDANETLYQPDCSSQSLLPSNALIIDDVAAGVQTRCARNWTDSGTLTWKFVADPAGNYPSKIDFHQIDTGFGGHYWYAHTWAPTLGNSIHAITGTWTLNQPLNGWARVLVYIPDHGAMDPQAMYTVNGSDTTSPNRTIVEGNYLDDNRHPAGGYWASLGSFHFTGTPSVSLDNLAHLPLNAGWGDGDRDVVWDAVAFQPLPGPPAHQVVAIGDSYTSGEGVTSAPQNGAYEYYRSSDHDGTTVSADNPEWRDACHRAPGAWPGLATLSDGTEPIISRMAVFDPTLDYHMSACSGATTGSMLRGDVGQYQEGAQLDQGYLDQHTTLVMFSVGGNDARFTPVLEQCLYGDLPGVLCKDSTISGDSAPLSTAEPDLINNTVEPAVEHFLSEVHALAPNARILLMGYPRLFDPGLCIPLLLPGDKDWLDSMGDTLDNALSTAAAHARAGTVGTGPIDVTFSDPRAAFTGQAVCGNPQNIHDFVFSLTRGDAPPFILTSTKGVVSEQSFHPTTGGAAIYARVATATLKSMGE